MTRADPGGGNIVLPDANGNPDGTILLDPQIWTAASVSIQANNHASADIGASIKTLINSTLDALNTLTFLEGAHALAMAFSDFSGKILLSLGCVGTNLLVVSSGLTAAAAAFASLDSALASTIAHLELQLPYYTTETTLMGSGVAPATKLQILGLQQLSDDGGLSISPAVAKALGITTVGVGAAYGLAATGAGSALLEFLASLALAAA